MKLPAKRTYIAILLVLVLALAGGGSWAHANHQADKNQAAEARADAKAARDAKAEAAADELAAETKAFCAHERLLSVLDNKALRVSVEKTCPGVIKKIVRADKLWRAQLDAVKKAARAAEDHTAEKATKDAEDDEPNGWEGSDPYCWSRYNVVIDGNGPGSPYWDYTDEDIARSEADIREYCADYEYYDSLLPLP